MQRILVINNHMSSLDGDEVASVKKALRAAPEDLLRSAREKAGRPDATVDELAAQFGIRGQEAIAFVRALGLDADEVGTALTHEEAEMVKNAWRAAPEKLRARARQLAERADSLCDWNTSEDQIDDPNAHIFEEEEQRRKGDDYEREQEEQRERDEYVRMLAEEQWRDYWNNGNPVESDD